MEPSQSQSTPSKLGTPAEDRALTEKLSDARVPHIVPGTPVLYCGFTEAAPALQQVITLPYYQQPGLKLLRELTMVDALLKGTTAEDYKAGRHELPVDAAFGQAHASFRQSVFERLSGASISVPQIDAYLQALTPDAANFAEYQKTGYGEHAFCERNILYFGLRFMKPAPEIAKVLKRDMRAFPFNDLETTAGCLAALLVHDREQAITILQDRSLAKLHPAVPRWLLTNAQFVPLP